MKPTLSPAGRLKTDRDRKKREREKLRARGLRPRLIWSTDGAWEELLPWLGALGIMPVKAEALPRSGKSDGAGTAASSGGKQAVLCSQQS